MSQTLGVDRLRWQEHELKTWPEFYIPIVSGEKTFELRKDDRGFKVGDILRLREWRRLRIVDGIAEGEYTGRETRRYVSYVLSGMGLEPGVVCMGLAPQAADTPAPQGEQAVMRQKPMTDDWLFTDEFNQTWRLRRTGDEGMPLLIELESKSSAPAPQGEQERLEAWRAARGQRVMNGEWCDRETHTICPDTVGKKHEPAAALASEGGQTSLHDAIKELRELFDEKPEGVDLFDSHLDAVIAAALRQSTEDVMQFVEHCREIRDGSPNAFYAYVDAFCKQHPAREQR
jgi:hypothetical protein